MFLFGSLKMETMHQNMLILWPWKQSARSRSLVAYNLLFSWLRILYTKSFHLDKLCLGSSQLNIEFANKISAKSDNYNYNYLQHVSQKCHLCNFLLYSHSCMSCTIQSDAMKGMVTLLAYLLQLVTCSSDLLSITT